MARVLVLEGNTPELCAARSADGLLWAGDAFGAALRVFAPDLEVEIARPYFGDHDPEAMDFGAVDGVVCTGSAVDWSADDERARPFWQAFERAFAADIPVLGCCWGLQLAAVVLGGRVGAGPNGVEAGIARDVQLTEAGRAHRLHHGRPERFDVLCMHRDDVVEPPLGAVVTARNDHTGVQGMVHEQAGFWGLQYHPEITLSDVAFYFERPGPAFPGSRPADPAQLRQIAADPEGTADLRAALGIGDGLTDPHLHGRELSNWLAAKIGAGTAVQA